MKQRPKRIEQMVDDFAARMKEKLLEKERQGWLGWDKENYRQVLENKLLDHAIRGIRGDPFQWLDVANFAAFLDYQTAEDHCYYCAGDFTEPICGERATTHLIEFVCTRPPGHDGDHVACWTHHNVANWHTAEGEQLPHTSKGENDGA